MFARLKLECTLLSMKIFCDVDVMAVMHVNSTSWLCEFVCEREGSRFVPEVKVNKCTLVILIIFSAYLYFMFR